MSHSASAVGEDKVLIDLVDEIARKVQAGEPVDVEAYLAAHPEHSDRLRGLLPAVEVLAELGRSASAREAAPSPVAADFDPERGRLGDFRMVREVGRGGMGVVYEAEQVSLGRRVALKVLPFAAALDPRQLQRFQNEARAAAHLHHSNIVPVHAVGCARGMHFYAMQFIDGRTVATLVRELRQRAGLEGPGPASGAGPALAWDSDPASGPGPEAAPVPPAPSPTPAPPPSTSPIAVLSTEGATRHPGFFPTVARLGLQAAEALEYAHAEGIVHRDIKPSNLLINLRGQLWITDFGLAHFRNEAGLTMTGDLLGTLRYMSPEQALGQRQRLDHRSDIYSLGATLYELLTLEPVHAGRDRQELLRQIATEEPRPLRRLNRAIPADLETVVLKALDKEPEARYATAQELADDLRRFLEDKPIQARRPSRAQRARKWARRHKPLVAAGGLVLLLGLLAWAVSTVLIVRQRDEARTQRAIAQAQRQLARQAVDDMYTEVAEEWLAQQPQLQEVQRRFLLKALHYYEEFAAEPGTDPALRFQAGVACHRVGDIDFKLGRHGEAEAAYVKAAALHGELAAEFPEVPAYRRELARSQEGLGVFLLEVGRTRQAELAHRQALALRERLAADLPADPDSRWELAMNYNTLGRLLLRTGRPQEAEHAHRQAEALIAALTAEQPAPAKYRNVVASVQNNLASVLLFHGRLPEAEQALRRSLAVGEKLAAESPTAPRSRRDLAMTRTNLGLLLAHNGRSEEAEPFLQQAVAARERLAAEFPGVPDYRAELASSHNILATVWYNVGRHPEAEEAYRQARALQERLAAEYPGVPGYRLHLAQGHHNLANVLEETSREPEAEAAYRQAIALFEKLAAELPRRPEVGDGLAESNRRRGYLLWRSEHAAEAAEAFRQARAAYEKRVADNPGVAAPARDLALFLADCPDLRFRDGPRAARFARQAVDRAPQEARGWLVLGVAQFRAGEWQAARQALQQAIDLGGGDSWGWFYLAMAHAQLGQPDLARQWYDRACAGTEAVKVDRAWLLRLRAEAAGRLDLPLPMGPSQLPSKSFR